ncbi:uncharacterized protein DUF3152 [Kribbella sp. VKM Ac-2527]|uniref:Uncharacterized protein DUF3152 n=1 Tax=Kribbella caucasensis TaxID=2512215 RepID=A0A4R6KPY3_9ACTN|nr:DUF3152 domain-containing protein [Kribbella sp. VKM Ac-2527]TDO54745.1 uncharacterized protein DUF3152 [Kribbella sp. VKM Ac-2527]
MRKLRIAGLGLAAAVVAGALVQLPASPFARNAYPDRPVITAANTPSADQPYAGQRETTKPTAPAKSSSAPTGPTVTYPARGTVSFAVLPGDPTTIGTSGRLLTYQIGIEGGIAGIDRTALARFVRDTYGAPQGWTAGGRWRFKQVGPGQHADFRVMFVTPATRDTYCGGGYDRYTSCRIGDRVVLNIARWAHGVPNYGASLTAYRQYMLNHETGHRLGEAHELCPGPGRPAPVMQQQTLGLHGCVAYAWPYRDNQRYEGKLGKYDDAIPAS